MEKERLKNYEANRFCKFCLERYPFAYGAAHFNRTPSPKETRPVNYILIYPSELRNGSYQYALSGSLSGIIETKLRRSPELLRQLKSGQAKLFRGYKVDVDYELEEIVKKLTFKE